MVTVTSGPCSAVGLAAAFAPTTRWFGALGTPADEDGAAGIDADAVNAGALAALGTLASRSDGVGADEAVAAAGCAGAGVW
ncbi:hypothetical protein GCM10027285_14350 [Oleiagrimonas citrea]